LQQQLPCISPIAAAAEKLFDPSSIVLVAQVVGAVVVYICPLTSAG